MTKHKGKTGLIDVKELLQRDEDFLRAALQALAQAALEAERFSTELFQRYQRSEKALVGTLAEMYVQGVSTRKVKAVTEALCGHAFSASAISTINKSLDEALHAFAERRLEEPFPYLILDARYERVREDGVIRSRAVLIAVRSMARVGARCSALILPTARAGPAGAISYRGSRSAACLASSLSSRTITRVSAKRSARSCRALAGSAAMCTS
jgi:hypothetical protein